LGTVAHALGDEERARTYVRDSLRVYEELGDRRCIGECREQLALLGAFDNA
jgi:hypothetical protein